MIICMWYLTLDVEMVISNSYRYTSPLLYLTQTSTYPSPHLVSTTFHYAIKAHPQIEYLIHVCNTAVLLNAFGKIFNFPIIVGSCAV